MCFGAARAKFIVGDEFQDVRGNLAWRPCSGS